MVWGINKSKLYMRARGVAITSASSVSGATGQALTLALTSNIAIADWQITGSSGNIQLDGAILSLIDISTAGSWSCTVVATDFTGRTGSKT